MLDERAATVSWTSLGATAPPPPFVKLLQQRVRVYGSEAIYVKDYSLRK